jgi:primosomal replication protein N
MDNQLVLTGLVTRKPVTRISPAGIPISRFGLEHQSRQMEAGGERSVHCWIRVVASGRSLQESVQRLAKDSRVRVTGFLARRSHRDPATELELHALHIDCLE